MNCIYTIRHRTSGLVKIGITERWRNRASQLGVGKITDVLLVVQCPDNRAHEDRLHKKFRANRIPQSEWFELQPSQMEDLLSEIARLGDPLPQPWEARGKAAREARRPKKQPRPPQPSWEEEMAAAARVKQQKMDAIRTQVGDTTFEVMETFVDCFDTETLIVNKCHNPWILDWQEPDFEEGAENVFGIVEWMDPISYGGREAFATISWSDDPETEHEISTDSEWMRSLFTVPPDSLDDLMDRLALLQSVPTDDWPDPVRARMLEINQLERRLEFRWGERLPPLTEEEMLQEVESAVKKHQLPAAAEVEP